MRSVLAIACVAVLLAQMPGLAQQAAAPQAQPPGVAGGPILAKGGVIPDSPADRLPITRVVLYKNGVGFFEHLGRVRGI